MSGVPDWKAAVRKSYPELATKSYFVPSVQLNKTKHTHKKLGSKERPVLVLGQPSPCAVQGDHAQQHALHCFQFLSQTHIMFVLSQIEFRNYLKHTDPHISKVWNPHSKDQARNNGDFDVAVILRHFGVFAMEIKSVGYNFDNNDEWSDKQKKAVHRKVREAIGQMSKQKDELCRYLSDLEPPSRVTMSLALPYVPRAQLKAILRSLPRLNKVKQFCGPATEVKLRTLREGVSHLGDEFTRLVLTPQQVDILNDNDPFVFLMGPPGVGKTIVLIQKALDWLEEGCQVHVVSIVVDAMAASELIYRELKNSELSGPNNEKVHLHHMALDGQTLVIDKLKRAATRGKVAIVMDEGYSLDSENKSLPETLLSDCELQKLLKDLADIRLWLVVSESDTWDCGNNLINLHFKWYVLDAPLRTPPTVTREVEKSILLALDYPSHGEAPLPSDGPPVIFLYHQAKLKGHSDSHRSCFQCGKDVAKVLTETLHVGQARVSTGQALQFKDVFILTHDNMVLYEYSQGSGFVDGLKEAGIPVSIAEEGNKEDMEKLVGADRRDEVVVAELSTVRGLERKVVVVFGSLYTFLINKAKIRLYGASRCTSQLVYIRNCAEGDVGAAGGGQE